MYCFQFLLLYNICCFATSQETYGILQDGVNNNGIHSSEMNSYTNVGNYVETKPKSNEEIFTHLDFMGKTLEESMKRIGMLEEKLRTYDREYMQIKLLEEKLLAAEEVTNKHSYRIKMLEKKLHKSEHARLVQVNALQRRLKEVDRRLLHLTVFTNRRRVAEKSISHVDKFEQRLRRGDQHLTELISESRWPPRTDRLMTNIFYLKNDNLTQATQDFVGIGANFPNYKVILKTGDPLLREKRSSDSIYTVIRGIQRLRIGISAAQNQHGVRVQLGQAIIFDKILFNDDGGFDMSSGMYRCPVSGLYFFTFTVSSFIGNRIGAFLVLNGLEKIGIYAGVGNDGNAIHDSIGIGSAIFLCHAGDLVWAKVNYGEFIGAQTSITGFLLWEDSQSS